jgi:hypothetical protein
MQGRSPTGGQLAIVAMDVLRTVVVYAHGYALVEACFLGCAACGP